MRKHAFLLGILLAGAWAAPASLAQATTPPTYVQPLTPSAVRLLQDHLRQAGNYSGRVDGIWGADSQAALERFQQTHGLQVTGQVNQVTASALGLAPTDLLATGQAAAPVAPGPVAPGAAPAAAVPTSLTPGAIRAVQDRLRALNFYSGGIDGMWGADTQAAIQRFQQGRGLQPTGQLNPATISALGLDPGSFMTPR